MHIDVLHDVRCYCMHMSQAAWRFAVSRVQQILVDDVH